jgi:hypothetical protein
MTTLNLEVFPTIHDPNSHIPLPRGKVEVQSINADPSSILSRPGVFIPGTGFIVV